MIEALHLIHILGRSQNGPVPLGEAKDRRNETSSTFLVRNSSSEFFEPENPDTTDLKRRFFIYLLTRARFAQTLRYDLSRQELRFDACS
jgi:hypothetical protein